MNVAVEAFLHELDEATSYDDLTRRLTGLLDSLEPAEREVFTRSLEAAGIVDAFERAAEAATEMRWPGM